MEEDIFLPGISAELVRAAYMAAPGNEIESGKFFSPESSAALVADTFGLFLDQPELIPPLPRGENLGWPAIAIELEAIVRFPWAGGRHPCLDVLIKTNGALIGVESKRYEPFRRKSSARFSDAYWRPLWGDRMTGYERVRDQLHRGSLLFAHLDAVQLVKHALGLRTAAQNGDEGRPPVLFYIYAEPLSWPDGRSINTGEHKRHEDEVVQFSNLVDGDEVLFVACSYNMLLSSWRASPTEIVRTHAAAVADRYHI